jgi:prophage antirepressor-like protein
MNELPKVFNYQNTEVRTVIKNNEPWFVAKDICDVLELENSRQALSRISDKHKGVSINDTLGGNQELAIIDEPGLYKLIFTSRKKEAEQFQDWVYEEVLPSIRKTGQYGTPEFLGKMHDSMNKIRNLSWHETKSIKKQHISENLAKLKKYYFSLIDSDAENEPNPFETFVKDRCTFDENSTIDRRQLYDGYIRWCCDNNVYPKSKIKLTDYLNQIDGVAYFGADSKHLLHQRFTGIKLNQKGLGLS